MVELLLLAFFLFCLFYAWSSSNCRFLSDLFMGAFGNTYVTWHSRYNLDLEECEHHSTMRSQNNFH